MVERQLLLLAIEADTPAEIAYLQTLAARMGLESSLANEAHAAMAETDRRTPRFSN